MTFRFKNMAEYNTWQAERNVKLRKSPNPELTKSKDRPDYGKESVLQAKIAKWAKERGFPCFHDYSKRKNMRGWPDLTICMPDGVVLFIELKASKGRMSKEQKHLQQILLYLGHNYYEIRSYKRFLEVVK